MQSLLGQRVYLDTNVFIYALEPSDSMQNILPIVTRLFELAVTRQLLAITSELSLAEALVGAYKTKASLVDLYDAFICSRPELIVYPVNRDVLHHAAKLRSQQKMALADAIHVATAFIYQADSFITHDKRIYTPSGLEKFTLEDLQIR